MASEASERLGSFSMDNNGLPMFGTACVNQSAGHICARPMKVVDCTKAGDQTVIVAECDQGHRANVPYPGAK